MLLPCRLIGLHAVGGLVEGVAVEPGHQLPDALNAGVFVARGPGAFNELHSDFGDILELLLHQNPPQQIRPARSHAGEVHTDLDAAAFVKSPGS